MNKAAHENKNHWKVVSNVAEFSVVYISYNITVADMSVQYISNADMSVLKIHGITVTLITIRNLITVKCNGEIYSYTILWWEDGHEIGSVIYTSHRSEEV